MATDVVTCFLRNDSEVLLFERSEEVGSYQGKWGGVAGHAEGDPDGAARQEIREETGIDPARVTQVRAGDPLEVVDGERTWIVHPYLFDCPTHEVATNWETAAHEWVPPTAILRRETVPDLWTSYDRVRPGVETVAGDRTHGSAYISVRALEVLRDEAALAATGRTDGDWDALTDLAARLRDARPSMTVVANRVNRAMTVAAGDGAEADEGTEERTPAAVERAAQAGVKRAVRADERAAANAAERLGERVATLSRSGTVLAALREADPEAVLVAESRPGREGVGVAENLASDRDPESAVTLTTDAALASQLDAWEADSLLVGADTVLADGRIVNKAGTRGAALAAAHEGIDVYVVAASDKIAPDETTEPDLEEREAGEVYDGEAELAVANPTFDVTPAEVVTVVTEEGTLDAAGVREVAHEHRQWAEWE